LGCEPRGLETCWKAAQVLRDRHPYHLEEPIAVYCAGHPDLEGVEGGWGGVGGWWWWCVCVCVCVGGGQPCKSGIWTSLLVR
jgi:hypothetical protein